MERQMSVGPNPARRHFLKNLLVSATIDAMFIMAAYVVTLLVYQLDGSPLDWGRFVLPMTFMIGIQVFVLYLCGVYNHLWSQTSGYEVKLIVEAVALTTFVIVLVDLLLGPNWPLSLTVILLGNSLSLGGLIAYRYRSRLGSSLIWRWNAIVLREFPKPKTRVLIVGAGEAGQTLAWRLKYRLREKDNFKIVGFVDDDPTKQGMLVEGCRIFGGRHEIRSLVEKHNIDLIIVAIHNISGQDFREMLEACEETSARIKVVPNVMQLMNATNSGTLLRDVQPEDLLGRQLVTRHKAVDLKPVMNRTVLVTGAAGSIGSEISRQLGSYDPVNLLLLDVNESGLHDLVVELKAKFPNLNLIPILVDIANRQDLAQVFARYQPQVVFHSAAYKHVPMLEIYPQQAVKINIGGTRNVAELAVEYRVERFVLISTDKAVNPSSVMGASKRICEMLIHALAGNVKNRTLFATVRFGNVLGSRGSVVPIFTNQIDQGGPLTVTHPEMTRYFMTIPEAANLVIHAACMTKGDEIFLLKMGEVVKILDLAERMIRMRGLRPYKDIEIRFSGIRKGEKMHEQLYDGSAENAYETIHPGIIRLEHIDIGYTAEQFFEWVDHITQNGISVEHPLQDLLWGMTPTEQYVAELS